MLIVLLTIRSLLNFIQGKKIVIEGEFTIVSKNENDTNFFTIQGKTFTLESHTKTKERYTVCVSDIIYQSYFVNENIKAAFASYEKVKTCDELEIKSTFEKKTIRKEG